MKAQILKIAGVKSEKAFYKKYPTEAAFFKAHPEAKSIKKAQGGMQTDSNNNGIPDYLEKNFPNILGNQSMGPGLGSNQYIGSNNGQAQLMTFGQNVPSYYNFGLNKPPQNWETPSAIPAGLPQSQPYGMNQYVQANNQAVTGQLNATTSTSTTLEPKKFNIENFGKISSGIKEGVDQYNAELADTRKLETWAPVSGVVKEAEISNAFLKKPQNDWFRPDARRFVHNANELSNTQGRGTDIYATQNGGGIGGNPTEVQNTYAPEHTLFDDLGYEPLQNDQQIKAYASGGGFGNWWGQANSALSGNDDTSFMGNVGQGSFANSFTGAGSNYNGGWKIGSSAGKMFGPLGEFVGGAIGGALDKNPGRQAAALSTINENNQFINRLHMSNGIHSANASHMKDGGWVSNDWQPQVIATFGEHKMKDLLRPPHDADMLRAGGHLREYTPPSERAMQTYENGGEMTSYAMGGQLKSHWGGHLETIAQNPYLPGSGEIVMPHGQDHKHGGIGISYGGTDDGQYQGHAANGAEMGAQVEAETREPIVQMASGGSVDPKTGKPSTEAVIFGNIPFTKVIANATGDKDLIKLAEKYNGKTYKKIIADFAAPQNKAAKTKIKAAELASTADNTKWGKLILTTAQAMEKGADGTQLQFANYIKKMANLQNATQEVKKEQSYIRGKNISAEALGKGKIETDYDPITKDAELENPYDNSDEVAKFGTSLRKAQNSTTVTPEDDSITEEEYNQFQKEYQESKATGNKKNPVNLNFQRHYHKVFPKEALAAIQKTTKEKGLSNKAKQMGLTVKDILDGKDVAKILESNEDEFYGPITEQYNSNVMGHFKKTPGLKLTGLGGTPTTATNTKKNQYDVVPYERNHVADIANMILPWMKNNKYPFQFDPRQLAGEYTAAAKNHEEPVPLQEYTADLDPVYRVSYQDVRDQNTADFRDVEKQNAYNPAAMAGLLGKKYLANNAVNAEEFRTNQAIEDKIFGGNRAKVNQERMANIQLKADQMDKQAKARTITDATQQAIDSSIADKYLQFDATKNKYLADSNLFPQYGFDSSFGIHNQGQWYQPNIPQIYGGKSTIEEVPVYGPDGKIQYYKMVETGKTTTDTTTLAPYQTTPYVASKKNGGKVTKNNRNSSIVKAYKNL
jgi:hypothetical protein